MTELSLDISKLTSSNPKLVAKLIDGLKDLPQRLSEKAGKLYTHHDHLELNATKFLVVNNINQELLYRAIKTAKPTPTPVKGWPMYLNWDKNQEFLHFKDLSLDVNNIENYDKGEIKFLGLTGKYYPTLHIKTPSQTESTIILNLTVEISNNRRANLQYEAVSKTYRFDTITRLNYYAEGMNIQLNSIDQHLLDSLTSIISTIEVENAFENA